MIKIMTNNKGLIEVTYDKTCASNPEYKKIINERVNNLPFKLDSDGTFNIVFGPEFKVVKTEELNDDNDTKIRYLDFVMKERRNNIVFEGKIEDLPDL